MLNVMELGFPTWPMYLIGFGRLFQPNPLAVRILPVRVKHPDGLNYPDPLHALLTLHLDADRAVVVYPNSKLVPPAGVKVTPNSRHQRGQR